MVRNGGPYEQAMIPHGVKCEEFIARNLTVLERFVLARLWSEILPGTF
jgi:hypothetical protein